MINNLSSSSLSLSPPPAKKQKIDKCTNFCYHLSLKHSPPPPPPPSPRNTKSPPPTSSSPPSPPSPSFFPPPCLHVQPRPLNSPFPLSDEQEEVVQCILNRTNTSVIAKAGSGKTTASLEVAKRFHSQHHSKTLLLTYNSRLKAETREKVRAMGIEDIIDAHSFHAAALSIFGPSKSYDDSLISRALLLGVPKHPLNYGLVIVDESQDMTPLYYKFLVHLLKFMNNPVLLMLGDPFQRIFGFHKSSTEYLLHPEKYFGNLVCQDSTIKFAVRHFTICWRITHEMAEWINANMNPVSLQYTHPQWWEVHGSDVVAWWGDGIRANPLRPPCPDSVYYTETDNYRKAIEYIDSMMHEYSPEDVAFLGYSLKNNTPIRLFVNRNADHNWLLLNKENDISPTEPMFRNKYVASTIHKFKGLERKGVAVMGVDSWIESLHPDSPLDHFNVYYVACTRAKEKLFVVGKKNNTYATLRKFMIEKSQEQKGVGVLDLLDYVPYDPILTEPSLFELTPEYQVTCDRFSGDEPPIGSLSPLPFLATSPPAPPAPPTPPAAAIPFSSNIRYVEGRSPGTVEDIGMFVGSAVHIKIGISFGTVLPIQYSKNTPKDLIEWVKQTIAIPAVEWSWGQVLTYAVAKQTERTQYYCYWRQLSHYTQNPPQELILFMEKSLNNTIRLLFELALDKKLISPKYTKGEQSNETMVNLMHPFVTLEDHIMFEFPLDWWTRKYKKIINGYADIIVDGKHIIEIKVSQNDCSNLHAMQVELYRCIKYLQTHKKYFSWVLVANKGTLSQVHLCHKKARRNVSLEKELLYRCVARKGRKEFNALDMEKDFKLRTKLIKSTTC